MNTQPIESGFAQMGARVKVREVPSRWTQGDRSWISPQDYSLDIRRDGKGEFFELRVPTHLSDALDVTLMQREPKQRHLLLFVRKPGDKPQLDRFLCGHDEREWFVAAVPGGASSVRQAMDALQPAPVRQALVSHKVSTNKRYSRKNRAFRRGANGSLFGRDGGGSQAGAVQRRFAVGRKRRIRAVFRTGGETVHVLKTPKRSSRRNTTVAQADPNAGIGAARDAPCVILPVGGKPCRPCHHHAAVLAPCHDEYRDPEPHDAQCGIPGLIINKTSSGVAKVRRSSRFSVL
jgi:hypothetical protein